MRAAIAAELFAGLKSLRTSPMIPKEDLAKTFPIGLYAYILPTIAESFIDCIATNWLLCKKTRAMESKNIMKIITSTAEVINPKTLSVTCSPTLSESCQFLVAILRITNRAVKASNQKMWDMILTICNVISSAISLRRVCVVSVLALRSIIPLKG